MKSFISRFTGWALLASGILGLLFSVAGLAVVGIYGPRVASSLSDTLDGLADALSVTSNGLGVAHTAILGADSAIDSLAAAMEGVNKSLGESRPTLTALSNLLGTELPDTIAATQESLASAQTSAKNIDGVLSNLSRIPLLGSLVYNPEVPLNETLGGISDSLDDIPLSLKNAQRGLDTAAESLDTINAELSGVTESTEQIRTSTGEAQLVIEDYQALVSDTQAKVVKMQSALPGQMRFAILAVVLFLIWLALAQIGLLTQAVELINRSKIVRSKIEDMTTNP